MSNDGQCETCKRTFGSQQAADQHMDSLKHWSPRLECDIDDQKSLVQRLADLSMGINPEEPAKSTVARSETVTATPQLQNHTPSQSLEDTKSGKPQFPCNICTRKFLTQSSLDQHRHNTGHQGSRFQCKACNKVFLSPSSVDQHKKATGHLGNPFQCKICSGNHPNKQSLDQHVKDTGHQEPQFKCDTCDGKFTSKSSAKQHMDDKSHHKQYNCPECKKGFKSQNALDTHVNMTAHGDKKAAYPSPSQEHTIEPKAERFQTENPSKTPKPAPRVPQLKAPHVEQITSSCQMYPLLHPAIANALAEHGIPVHFHNINSEKGFINYYSTNITGKITCVNKLCTRGTWGTGRVAIRIRKYPNDRYNAAVYNQGCQKCKKLGRLFVDEQTYIERVSYRLKKWTGVDEEPPEYREKGTPPHREDLCEGCKAGICMKGVKRNYWEDLDGF
ncbi:Zinc-binding domain containing protein [Pyrenophora tritici-repentis]|uniref:Zinc-binding domain containing protein n=1 Tax=Pyrenophora tritici-repentis TaxID=45151 RepID=A0A922NC85_9PLEO|nr:Zinc-binding domain containing protein [Pyrenophora tritici-repentis]